MKRKLKRGAFTVCAEGDEGMNQPWEESSMLDDLN